MVLRKTLQICEEIDALRIVVEKKAHSEFKVSESQVKAFTSRQCNTMPSLYIISLRGS